MNKENSNYIIQISTSFHNDKHAKQHEINVLRHQADDYYIKAAIQSISEAKL